MSWRLLDISQPDTWCENTTNDISGGNCLLLKLMDHQMNDFNKISNHWVNNYSSCSSSPERAHSTPQSNTLTEQYQQMIELKQNTQIPQWPLFWRDREPWRVTTKTMRKRIKLQFVGFVKKCVSNVVIIPGPRWQVRGDSKGLSYLN